MERADALPLTDAEIADEHDDDACSCDSCERERVRDSSRATKREASVRGGLFPLARELLGASLLMTFDANTGGKMDLGQLAQKALGESFATLGELAESAADSCRSKYGLELTAAPARAELAALIEYGEQLLQVAKTHLDYLPYTSFRIGSPVAWTAYEGERVGRYSGATKTGHARVSVAPDGEPQRFEEVPHVALRQVSV